MIAPYVIHGSLDCLPAASDIDVFNQADAAHIYYRGAWFDIGDPDSLVKCVGSWEGYSMNSIRCCEINPLV